MELRELILAYLPKKYQKEEIAYAEKRTEKLRQLIVRATLKLREIYGRK